MVAGFSTPGPRMGTIMLNAGGRAGFPARALVPGAGAASLSRLAQGDARDLAGPGFGDPNRAARSAGNPVGVAAGYGKGQLTDRPAQGHSADEARLLGEPHSVIWAAGDVAESGVGGHAWEQPESAAGEQLADLAGAEVGKPHRPVRTFGQRVDVAPAAREGERRDDRRSGGV